MPPSEETVAATFAELGELDKKRQLSQGLEREFTLRETWQEYNKDRQNGVCDWKCGCLLLPVRN
jgi:hypothetical protein